MSRRRGYPSGNRTADQANPPPPFITKPKQVCSGCGHDRHSFAACYEHVRGGERCFCQEAAQGRVPSASMTPLGLMIGPLNTWLTHSVEPAADCAEVILDRLRRHGYSVVHTPCGEDWTACTCKTAPARVLPAGNIS